MKARIFLITDIIALVIFMVTCFIGSLVLSTLVDLYALIRGIQILRTETHVKEDRKKFVRYILPTIGCLALNIVALMLLKQSSGTKHLTLFALLPTFINFGVTTPIIEEFFFRYIPNSFDIKDETLKNVIYYGIAVFLFAFAHCTKAPLVTIAHIPGALLLAVVYKRNEKLSQNVKLHAINNLICVLLGAL